MPCVVIISQAAEGTPLESSVWSSSFITVKSNLEGHVSKEMDIRRSPCGDREDFHRRIVWRSCYLPLTGDFFLTESPPNKYHNENSASVIPYPGKNRSGDAAWALRASVKIFLRSFALMFEMT